MLLDELYEKKEKIYSIIQKYRAKNLWVFGSVARKEETENSDIDLLVSLDEGYDLFKQRIPLQEELENLFGRKVDLIIKHELNKHLAKEILSSCKEI